MELKVWVEGIQRIVCGVSNTTTCQDVVYALAHATGKTGRFTLIERWRNSERLLAPHEHPLKILLKWGEHASDVQLILQRSDLEPKAEKSSSNLLANFKSAKPVPHQRVSQTAIADPSSSRASPSSPAQSRDIKKSLTFCGGHAATNPPEQTETKKEEHSKLVPSLEPSPGSNVAPSSSSTVLNRSPTKQQHPNNVDAKKKGDINENLIMMSNMPNIDHHHHHPIDHHQHHPMKGHHKEGSFIKDIIKQFAIKEDHILDHRTEEVVVDAYYRDLVKLVNQQRDKLSSQQADLTKFEAEIAFTEGRRKEEESRLTYIQSEMKKLENLPEEKLESNIPLDQLETQFKLAKQSEIKSLEEIASIKSKLEDCDHQLSKITQRIRMLHEAIHSEQKSKDSFKEEQQDAILREIEKLQMAVMQATKQADQAQTMSQTLIQEMTEAESLLGDKRKEIEVLRQAMKEANMEALTMTPPEDAKSLSENRTGNGTSRRMKGSPRQLETAVPTSKNPHGVWV